MKPCKYCKKTWMFSKFIYGFHLDVEKVFLSMTPNPDTMKKMDNFNYKK